MQDHIAEIVRLALSEDIGSGDVTSLATIPGEIRAQGIFIAKEPLVLTGLDVAREVFAQLSSCIRFTPIAYDGASCYPGNEIATVTGSARDILTGERVALNFLMHLSGIATLTRRFVEAVSGTNARIVDTRKTTPGLRWLEKQAVRAGGGHNHRFGLDDGILIKDNHIEIAGSVTAAVERARAAAPHLLRIEVEIEDNDMLREALACGAEVVLLDNMSPDQVAGAVRIARTANPRILIEVSGGITLDTVHSYAEAGADIISAGALTHSARAADISLEVRTCRT